MKPQARWKRAPSISYAYGARMDGRTFRIYCLCPTASRMLAIRGRRRCLPEQINSQSYGGIDRSNIQINGMTEQVMPLALRQYEAFGWHVLEIDGHNINVAPSNRPNYL